MPEAEERLPLDQNASESIEEEKKKDSRRPAATAFSEMENREENRQEKQPSRMEQLLPEYENYLLFSLHSSSLTASAYLCDLRHLVSWMKEKEIEDPEDLETADLVCFLNTLAKDHESSSVIRVQSALRSFYDWLALKEEGQNPAAVLPKRKKNRALPLVMREDQVQDLLDTFSEEPRDQLWKTFFMLCYGSGLRVSECCGIRLQQISLSERQIRIVGKGNRERLVFLHARLCDQIEKYLQEDRPALLKQSSSFLFPGKDKGPVSRTQANYQIKKHLQMAGLPSEYSTHTLRHAFATRLMEKDTDLRLVQELLGHADISTTQIYTHVDASRLHKVYDSFMPEIFSDKGGNEK